MKLIAQTKKYEHVNKAKDTRTLAGEIDSLDPDDRHYIKRKADLDDRLYRMYDKIEDVETRLIETRAKKLG